MTQNTPKLEQVLEAVKFLGEYVRQIGDQAKAKDKHDVTSAIRLFDLIHTVIEEVKAQVKTPLEGYYDVLRFGVVPDLMTDADMTTVHIEDIGRCTITDDVQVSIPADKKEELFDWLIAHELEDMIKRQVNAQTLAAFVRKRMKEGKELPTECLKVTPVTRAAITRSK